MVLGSPSDRDGLNSGIDRFSELPNATAVFRFLLGGSYCGTRPAA